MHLFIYAAHIDLRFFSSHFLRHFCTEVAVIYGVQASKLATNYTSSSVSPYELHNIPLS